MKKDYSTMILILETKKRRIEENIRKEYLKVKNLENQIQNLKQKEYPTESFDQTTFSWIKN